MVFGTSIRRSWSCKGFTLIEVILSIMILALGIVSVQRVFLRSLSFLTVIENYGQAERLLEEKIWDLGNEVRSQGSKFRKEHDSGSLLGSDRVFQYDMNLHEIGPDGNLMEVDAVVSWDRRGMNRSIKRTFYLMVPYGSWKN